MTLFSLFPRRLAACALAALLVGPPVAAQETPRPSPEGDGGVHEGLFATGALESVGTGETITFRHERSVEPDNALIPDFEGTAEITVAEAGTGGREARVALVADGRSRPVPPLPAEAGHPLLLVFLETAVNTMAQATGGSPFYIRNRIRDTLWTGGEGEPAGLRYDGTEIAAEELVYRPFVEDPNRAGMGGFADLELRFLVSDALPGGIGLFEFHAPEGGGAPEVHESLTLRGLEEEAS